MTAKRNALEKLSDETIEMFRHIVPQVSLCSVGRLPKLVELTQAHRSHLYQRGAQASVSRRNPPKTKAGHRKVASAYTAWAAVGGTAALLVHFQNLSLLAAYAIVLIPAAALLVLSRRFPK